MSEQIKRNNAIRQLVHNKILYGDPARNDKRLLLLKVIDIKTIVGSEIKVTADTQLDNCTVELEYSEDMIYFNDKTLSSYKTNELYLIAAGLNAKTEKDV